MPTDHVTVGGRMPSDEMTAGGKVRTDEVTADGVVTIGQGCSDDGYDGLIAPSHQ